MFLESFRKWLARRSLKQFFCLLLLARVTDVTTAFLVFWFRPESFLAYEANQWTKAALGYGETWKLLIPEMLFWGISLTFIMSSKFLKRPVLVDSAIMYIIFNSFGAAATNIGGLIIGWPTLENFLYQTIVVYIYLLLTGIGIIFVLFAATLKILEEWRIWRQNK